MSTRASASAGASADADRPSQQQTRARGPAEEALADRIAIDRTHAGQQAVDQAAADRVTVDRIFTALADPTRRLVLEVLGQRHECSATTIARLTPVSRQAVVKHLSVLDEAGLVAGRRSGREVLFRVRPEGLSDAASWMTDLAAAWDHRLHRLKEAAESAETAASPEAPAPGEPATSSRQA